MIGLSVLLALPASANNPPVSPEIRGDFVGNASTGMASLVENNGKPQKIPVRQATFFVRNEENGCKPSNSNGCRFVIELLEIQVGAFKVANTQIASAVVRNQGLIPIEGKP